MQDVTVFIAKHMGLFYMLATVLIALMLLEFFRAKRSHFHVGPKEAVQLINKHHAVVVDVRNSESYNKGHILNALSISSQEIASSPKKLNKYKGKPIILVCNNGTETNKIASQLMNEGYSAFSLIGGINAWNEANLPIVRD